MVTFPDYDYGWSGGTEAAIANATGNEAEATAGTAKPAPEFSLGVVFDDTKAAATGIYQGAKNLVSSAYWNLIAGVAIIGVIVILVLGLSTRAMRQIEGG